MVSKESQPGFGNANLAKAAERFLIGGLFLLVLGVFLGNAFIAGGQILVVIGVISWFVREKGFLSRARKLPASTWWIIAFAVFSVISVLANWQEIERPLSYIKKVRYYLIYASVLLIPMAFWRTFSKGRIREVFVMGWLVPLILAFVVGLIGVIRKDHPFADLGPVKVERLAGLQGEVMTFAYGLQFTVIALSIFFFSPSWWKSLSRIPRKWLIFFAIVAGVAMYLTYSRGAMLGVVVGLTAFAMLKSRYLLIGVVVVGFIGGCVAAAQGARYLNFDESVRGNQWKSAAISFMEKPVFGLGYRNFEANSVALKERYGIEKDVIEVINGVEVSRYFMGHAHNNFLEAFASTGVFGGLALVGFCIAWTREAWASRYRALFIPLIVAFLVSGCFENTFFDSELLNCVFLIYLFSQVAIASEGKRWGSEDEPSNVSFPQA